MKPITWIPTFVGMTELFNEINRYILQFLLFWTTVFRDKTIRRAQRVQNKIGVFSNMNRSNLLIIGVVAIAPIILALSLWSALNAQKRPFPSMFLDPYGCYSNVSYPGWQNHELDLRYPDQLVSIDGSLLPEDYRKRGLALEWARDRFEKRLEAGKTTSRLTFFTGDGKTVHHTRDIRRMEKFEFLFFFLLYVLVGLFVLWSGFAIWYLAEKGTPRLVYFLWAVTGFTTFTTFYDYHTLAVMRPVFSFSTVTSQFFFIWLAYAFPAEPTRFQRPLRILIWSCIVVLGVIMAVVVFGPLIHLDVQWARSVVTQIIPMGFLCLIVSCVIRLFVGKPIQKKQIQSACFGLLLVPLILLGIVAVWGYPAFHLAVPIVVPLIPFSIGFALIRNNILLSPAPLTKRILHVPMGYVAFASGASVYYFVRRSPADHDLAVVLLSLVTALVVYYGCFRLLNRLLFRAAYRFKPIIETLSNKLARVWNLDEIQQQIKNAVSECMTIKSIDVLTPEQLVQLSKIGADAVKKIHKGQLAHTSESVYNRSLLVPMRSMGELRGVLIVGPKLHGALYTDDDLRLLATIASLGSVALQNAEAFQEIQLIREMQVNAANNEKQAAIELFAAEVAHELALPLNYFRYLIDSLENHGEVDNKELEIGQEEIQRLSRMLSTLRELKGTELSLSSTRVISVVDRAKKLLMDLIEETDTTVKIDVDRTFKVKADFNAFLQIIANLFRNGIHASKPKGTITIALNVDDEHAMLDIRDTGPGVPENLKESIFMPWVKGKSGGSGLGLAIAGRLASRQGWKLSYLRDNEETCFRIQMPTLPNNGRRSRPSIL